MVRMWLMSALTALAVFGMAELKGQTTWTGSVSTDWGNASNWSAGVTTSAVDAVIPSGTTNSPLVTLNATRQCRNLTVALGATLTVTGTTTSSYYFDIYGKLTVAGTMNVTRSSTGIVYVRSSVGGSSYGAASVTGTFTVTNNTSTNSMYVYTYYGLEVGTGGIFTMAGSYVIYHYNYGSLTNGGTYRSTGTLNYHQLYNYGNLTNNGTVTGNYLYLRAYYSSSYHAGTTMTWSGNAISCGYFYVYITVASVRLVLNCNLTTAVASSQSTYLTYGELEIGANVTLTTYGFYTLNTTAAYNPKLFMSQSTARIIATNYFYVINMGGTWSAGTIEAGSAIYMYSNAWNVTGGTFIVRSTATMYFSGSYTSAAFFNLQIGTGTGMTCTMSPSGTGAIHQVKGALTVSSSATLSAASSAVRLQIKGNWVHNGTYNANSSMVECAGVTTMSGTGTFNLHHLQISTGSTLTAPATINLSGNFTNSGTFNHNNGNFIIGGTGTSALTGNTTFYLFGTGTGGKTIQFAAGSTTTVTSHFVMVGTTSLKVLLRSSVQGNAWNLNSQATETVSDVDVRDSNSTNSVDATSGGIDSGNNTNWIFPPRLDVAASAGSAQALYADATGNGNGIQVGTFTITASGSSGPTLTSITIASSGSGFDHTAYSEVRLYYDTGGTTGSYDAGVDTAYGALAVAFPSDNGSLTFSATLAFTAAQARTFFVVVKLNGATLALPGHQFFYQVSSITVQTGLTAGTPSTVMAGVTIQTPSFAFADQGGTAATAYPSSGGHVLQEFTVGYAAGPANSLSSLTLGSDGTGDDSTDYDTVAIYHDSNTNGSFDAGTDTLVGSQTAFATDNGTATITLSGSAVNFSAGQTKTFFVVCTFNSNPAQGETFATAVTAAAYGYTGTTSSTLPAPAAGYSPGVTIDIPGFTVADTSPGAQANAYMNGSGFMLQRFTIAYPSGPTNAVTGITVTASGTGDDLSDYASVDLYRDANSNSTYDAGTDVQVDTTTAFSADNGTVTFALSGSESVFAAGTTREYFVIVGFNTNGSNGDTFQSQITGVSGTQFGATVAGTPAPATAAPGLLLQDNRLVVTLNGPGGITSVNSNSSGSFGNGELLCDVTLTAGVAAAWSVNTLSFEADGTGGHTTDFSQLALYEDNGNAAFDAADTLAAPAAVAFAAGTLDVTFTLSNPSLPGATARRFFLAGILNGLAVSGETFNASLSAAGTTPPTGGTVSGVPTAASTALIIDTTVLSVGPGPANPAAFMHKAGTALDHVLGQMRLSATNNAIDVTAITFATAGSGNWIADTDSANGYQVWLDDGDGVFSALTDTQLFASGGAGSINAVFASTVTVPNAGFRDLWIRTSLLSSAAVGSTSPLSWSASIASTTDVSTVGGVLVSFGITSPQTSTLSAVDFFVTTFTPVADLPAGGKPITISGSGFMSPLVVRINGVICPGTPAVTPTQVTGLLVPPGTGSNVAIEITSGALAPQVLTQTFTYENVTIIGPGAGGGGGGGGGGGCAAATGSPAALLLALLAALSVVALRRNRSNRTTA